MFRWISKGLFLFLVLCGSTAWGGWGHKPPERPLTGYGSTEHYITNTYTRYELGSASVGDKTWYYIPETLKYGSKAPVVIYLHGFSLLFPSAYLAHIEHLVYQGNIVIFPQFQKSTLLGFLSESGLFKEVDQLVWADRAVDSVADVFDRLGDQVDSEQVYLTGHSLGGLIALAWEARGGVPVRAILLSHPQVDSSAGMPDFVRDLVKVKDIPWQEFAPDISAPVVILNGVEDQIAPITQSEDVLAHLDSNLQKAFYVAQSDRYGYPRLSPNHGAPLNEIKGLPAHLKIFGISGELDALDWRFYWVGLDAVMDGLLAGIPFDMGYWSDGTPALPILESN